MATPRLVADLVTERARIDATFDDLARSRDVLADIIRSAAEVDTE